MSSLTRQSFRALIIALVLLFFSFAAFAEDGGRKVRTKVNPTYPELARRMNVHGTVKLEVVVAANGNIKSTRVIGGHPILVGAAEDAIKRWKYEPASDETTAIIEFNFAPGM